MWLHAPGGRELEPVHIEKSGVESAPGAVQRAGIERVPAGRVRAAVRHEEITMRSHDRFYIGGQWVAPAGSATLDVISPHTEEVIGRVPDGTTADMDRAVAAARDAFDNGPWPQMDPADRAAAVGRLADIYAARLGDSAQIITDDMGSPITYSHLAP